MSLPPLSRREREILEVLYSGDGLTVTEVQAGMAAPPGYSAVRALLRILESKGHIRHEPRGAKYVFWPVVSRAKAGRSALQALVQTFFGGAPEQAVAALIQASAAELSAEELDRMAALIQTARMEGK